MLMNINAGFGSQMKLPLIAGKYLVVCPSTHAMFQNLKSIFKGDGEGEVRFFQTVTAANSAAVSGRGDVILIAPGTYTLTAALAAKANTSYVAIRKTNSVVPNVVITASTASIITVDVDDVVFDGIKFLAGDNAVNNIVVVADTADVNGLTFKDCVFDGADKTSVAGILATDAAKFPTGLVVDGCLFKDLTGTHISIGALGAPYAKIVNNHFAIDVNSGTGISLADTGAVGTGKGYIIRNNLFTGLDATADEVGITIAGTENTTALGMIADNRFAYLATAAITADKVDRSIINNYVGDAGTGGTLVDSGTP